MSLAQSAATLNRMEGRHVAALGEQLAGNRLLRDRLTQPGSAETMAPLVQNVLTQAGATTVSVGDARGRVVSSTNRRGPPGRTGRPGAAARPPPGRRVPPAPWMGYDHDHQVTATGQHRRGGQIRTPIADSSGTATGPLEYLEHL